jgi:hypothetical protein
MRAIPPRRGRSARLRNISLPPIDELTHALVWLVRRRRAQSLLVLRGSTQLSTSKCRCRGRGHRLQGSSAVSMSITRSWRRTPCHRGRCATLDGIPTTAVTGSIVASPEIFACHDRRRIWRNFGEPRRGARKRWRMWTLQTTLLLLLSRRERRRDTKTGGFACARV